MIDVIIPTCKENVSELIKELQRTTHPVNNIIATCSGGSASQNRNRGLKSAESELVIMMDDDMTGFYDGWIDDMLRWWKDDIAIMAARLLTPDNNLGYMLSEDNRMSKGLLVVPKREVPTACVMFKNDGLRFDENFIGSGFEDNDFCRQLQAKYPEKSFVVNNECRLIHTNEKKNQHGHYWHKNQAYYQQKWGI